MRFYAALTCLTVCLLAGPPARADFDTGEIAVIEDSDGSIHANAVTQFFQAKAACRFYRTHADRYDALFFFTTRPLNLIANVAQGFPVNSPSAGIGRGEPPACGLFCSSGCRLRHAVKMASIPTLEADPDRPCSRALPGYPLSCLELLGHEFGHQWLANVDFDRGEGAGRQCLLRAYIPVTGSHDPGAERCSGHMSDDFNQHWSTRLNQNSVMYSNSIEDNGDGTFRV